MRQSIRKITPFFSLAIFLVATMPDELIHLLADHHDTVDSNSQATSVSRKHIHCEALQLTLPSFITPERTQLPSSNHLYSSPSYQVAGDHYFTNGIHLPSRAPPVEV